MLTLVVATATLAAALAAPTARHPLGGEGLPVRAPNSVGMSAGRLEAIDRVVMRGVRAGGFPGGAVVVGRKGAAVWQRGFGSLDWTSASSAVSADRTLYDLASLTKVVGTTAAIMILYDQGKIDLDAPVSKYLPAFAGGLKDRITTRLLLEHRAGLPAGRDLFRVARNPQEARLMVIDTPLEYTPGTGYIYSDLGADILGMEVESVSGLGLDEFLTRNVFEPLGMTETGFRPDASLRNRIAPTEMTPPRGYPLRGEVHDENAYALGGVAGHAGLFSTAADLAVFAQMMLDGGVHDGVRLVSPQTVAMFTRRIPGTHRALGWDTCDGDGGCGKYLSDRAYGHTGFTGTSIWIDPEREMFVILLTNRVHDARAKRPAKVISDVRADLADAAALAVLDAPDGPLAWPARFRADREIGWNRPERSARHSTSSRAARARAARQRHAAAARKARAGSKTKSGAAKSTTKKRSR